MFSGLTTDQKLSTASSLFNGNRLSLARQLKHLNKSALAAQLNVSPSSVSAWEAGRKRPSRGTIAHLSLALDVDPLFFTGGTPPTCEMPFFRSLRSISKSDRDEAGAYSSMALELIEHFERIVTFPDLQLTTLSPRTLTPAEAAMYLREKWGVPTGPIQHTIRLCEAKGIFTIFSRLSSTKVDAYSTMGRNRALIILNPAKHDYYRQRFDVAHELGHLVMHSEELPGNAIEQEAHTFAAEFLMPASEIASQLPASTTGKGWRTLQELKEYWGVSLAALLYRARTLSVMSDVTYRNAMMHINRNGWRQNEPGRVSTVETPSLLPQTIDLLASSGQILTAVKEDLKYPEEIFETISSRSPQSSYSAISSKVATAIPQERTSDRIERLNA